MIFELAHYGFIFAGLLFLAMAVCLFYGFKKEKAESDVFENWAEKFIARGLYAEFMLILFALMALFYGFAKSIFSLAIVWRHSSTIDPIIYKLTSVWGSHEGSVLLWLFLMLLFTGIFYMRRKKIDQKLWIITTAFLFLVQGLLSLYIILTSNPFLRSVIPTGEGQSLNPLLQDPLFVIHPPLLFLGYAATLFPFCLTLGSFVTGVSNKNYVDEIRYWTLKAWSILIFAILLGSYWAYYELGWGGWWFWDPVENVSLLPWLICLSLFHVIIAFQKKGLLLGWIQLLSVVLFLLTILGFFLVRSGLLVSVHSFVVDPVRGLAIAVLFGVLLLISLGSYALSIKKKKIPASSLNLSSREMMLIFGAFLFLISIMVIILGTFMPLLVQYMTGEVISVGAPYYNKIFALLFPAFALTMSLGIWFSWQKSSMKMLRRKLMVSTILLICISISFFYILGTPLFLNALVFISVLFIFIATLYDAFSKMKGKRFIDLSKGYKAMLFGHLSFALMCFAIVTASSYGIITERVLEKDTPIEIGPYDMKYVGLKIETKQNFQSVRAILHYQKDDHKFSPLQPERRYYDLSQTDLSESALRSNLLHDVMVVLGPVDFSTKEDHIQIRFYHYPLAIWIWIGALLMTISGVYALFRKRKN